MSSTLENKSPLQLGPSLPSRTPRQATEPAEHPPTPESKYENEAIAQSLRSTAATGWSLTILVLGFLVLGGAFTFLPKSQHDPVRLWGFLTTGLCMILVGVWAYFASKRSLWVLGVGTTFFYVWLLLGSIGILAAKVLILTVR